MKNILLQFKYLQALKINAYHKEEKFMPGIFDILQELKYFQVNNYL